MKRISIMCCLLLCIFVPTSSAESEPPISWEIDLQNGYISTKPVFVGDQLIVRTSGFWTGDDRPHVYSFDYQTGQENWRFVNSNSTNHDMSPLLYVEAGAGECGTWPEMVIVGWTDGRVTALDIADGDLIWTSQTEVVTWGITGAMALDGDHVVVPTRQGLSTFCLGDGNLDLRVDLPQLGWRNGVTVTDEAYLIGNEEGVLNIVNRSGEVENLTIGDGMIRHAPIQTSAGIITHLQTSSESGIYLGTELLSSGGPSPAIPLQLNDKVFFATSESVSLWICNIICEFHGQTDFHTNGEITAQVMGNNTQIWFPRNTAEGGWGFGLPGTELSIYSTNHDTYTTAGVGFGPDGYVAFGNDAGVLMVTSNLQNESGTGDNTDQTNVTDLINTTNQSSEYTNQIELGDGRCEATQASEDFSLKSTIFKILISILVAAMFLLFLRGYRELVAKLSVILLLMIALLLFPSISQIWSSEVSDLRTTSEDWDEDWPKEWQDTQIVVFELPDGEVVIGGCSGHETVQQLTESAAEELGIEIERETFSIGEMIVSFNGHELNGWEFTVDGQRSTVGISAAVIDEDSVVRWSAA